MNRINELSSELQYDFININTLSKDNIEQTFSMMTEEKRARVNSFQNPDSQLRSIAAEYLARKMLSIKLDISPEHIHFSCLDSGKPIVIDLPYHVSFSHSRHLAMCAISDRPVGADVEIIGKRGHRLISRVCTPQEADYILSDGIYDPARFYKVWTAKEAILKHSGKGLAGGFSSISTADTDGILSIVDGLPLMTGIHDCAAYAVYG